VKLTTQLYLVSRTRMSESVAPLPQYALMAWCLVKAQGKLHLYLYHAMKTYWGSGGTLHSFFDLSTSEW